MNVVDINMMLVASDNENATIQNIHSVASFLRKLGKLSVPVWIPNEHINYIFLKLSYFQQTPVNNGFNLKITFESVIGLPCLASHRHFPLNLSHLWSMQCSLHGY